MKKLKGIKRLVNCGLITLVAFNLFVGCEQSNLFGPVEEGEYTSQELSPILFELDSRLSVDANGFHHITIDTTKWQTIHRISGHVYRDGNPVNVIKFAWTSSHHWYIGDDFGYVIANNGLTDDMTYVGYDTTYITWFGGEEVPIVNGASYSNEDGEVNTMIAPVRSMVGDTATIFYVYHDNWTYKETYGGFHIIFD